MVSVLIGLLVYFAPTVVAYLSDHRSRGTIFFLNLILGFTIIGWVVCLFWAICK